MWWASKWNVLTYQCRSFPPEVPAPVAISWLSGGEVWTSKCLPTPLWVPSDLQQPPGQESGCLSSGCSVATLQEQGPHKREKINKTEKESKQKHNKQTNWQTKNKVIK